MPVAELAVTPTQNNLVETSMQFVVTTAKDSEEAAGIIRGLKELEKKIIDHHDPVVESANRAHKAAVEAKRAAVGPVTVAINSLRGKIANWYTQQEDARREAEMRLRQEAEAAARKVREAEVAECRRKEEEHRKREEALRATLAAQGVVVEEDEQVIDMPVIAPPAPLNTALHPAVYFPPVEAPAGVSFSTRIRGEVDNKKAFMEAVIKGDLPMDLVEVDQAKLNRYVREHRDTIIPGVTIVAEKVSRFN